MSTLNNLQEGKQVFTPEAFKKLKYLYLALAQKVMRERTQKDMEQVSNLIAMRKAWFG